MTKRDEIKKEIKKLEEKPLSYDTCQKLAILYIVYDHMAEPGANPMMPAPAPAIVK